MKSLLRTLFSRQPPAPAARFDAPIAPDETLAVVGDIHGCDRLLEGLLGQIEALAPDRVVFVGDYVDRGEESAAVLDRLRARAGADPRAVFLRGNHEAMLLAFLDDPAAQAARWLRYGGLQTLASYSVGAANQVPNPAEAERMRDALAAAMGEALIGWLRALPTRFVSGNVAVVHAGASPALPLADQLEKDLVWGHPDFFRLPRQDGLWIVHGHTIQDQVEARDGRIGVDTGAYATGRLSAALLRRGGFSSVTQTYAG